MFCPGCGFRVSDDLKFCRQCGANLRGVREAMISRSAEDRSDPNQSWWSDMMSAAAEAKQLLSSTPEEKRIKEIKGGVITIFVGLGLMIFLSLFMPFVAEQSPPHAAEILRHVWLAGIIPLLIGIGLLINGFFVSRRLVQLKEQQAQMAPPPWPVQPPLPAKTTDQLVLEAAPSTRHSVIEDTTAHLPDPVAAPPRREIG